MKKLLLAIFAITILIGCTKEALTPLSQRHSNGNGIISSFTDLSDWGQNKLSHPFFSALKPHAYSVELYAAKAVPTGTTASYNSQILDSSGNPMDIGAAVVDGYTLKKDDQGHYATDGVDVAADLFQKFGNNVSFTFPGINNNITPFSGKIYLPEVLFIPNISGTSQPSLNISRSSAHTLSIAPDLNNDNLPLAVVCTWDANLDPDNASFGELTVNRFLVDDDGTLELSPAFFHDMPKEAKYVSVKIWRGNAVTDAQDFYFFANTTTSFWLNLTD